VEMMDNSIDHDNNIFKSLPTYWNTSYSHFTCR